MTTRLILLFFLVSLSTKAFSPNDTIWYSKSYIECKKNTAEFYKLKSYSLNKKYVHVYFYKSSNKTSLISYSLDANDTQFDGKRTFYYKNGSLKSILNYKNELKDGDFISYYENSKIRIKATFKMNKLVGFFCSL